MRLSLALALAAQSVPAAAFSPPAQVAASDDLGTCLDGAESLREASQLRLGSETLRARADRLLTDANASVPFDFQRRASLQPVFAGFSRRIAEAEPGELGTEIADIADSIDRLCRMSVEMNPGEPAPIERDRLQQILSRPEFDLQDEPVGVLDRLWRWIRKLFLSLLESRGTMVYAEAGRYAVMGLGVICALYVLTRIVRSRRRPAGRQPSPAVAVGRSLDSPDEHVARSRQAQALGLHREAVREQMLAVLSSLERRHYLTPGRAQTNREIAAATAKRGAPSDVVARFGALAEWYDSAWYGLAVVTSIDAAQFAANAESVRAAVEGRP
jgi:hypothetical protein